MPLNSLPPWAMRACALAILCALGLLPPASARAEFVIGNAIIEFTADGPRQQDVELASRSKQGNDYIVSEISEILNPGTPQETRQVIDDPTQSMLLVTPDKTILPAESRKLLRFVLLKDPDEAEHVFRVAIKPVIKGVDASGKLGLKVLIGYEVLVIVRPATLNPSYSATRQGKTIHIENNGNSDILLQNGQQCPSPGNCQRAPVVRVYAGQKATIDLPLNSPADYSIWDGKDTIEKRFD